MDADCGSGAGSWRVPALPDIDPLVAELWNVLEVPEERLGQKK